MRIRLCGYLPITVSIFRRGAMHPDRTRPGDRARRQADSRGIEVRDHDNDRTGPDVPVYPGTTRHGKLHTHTHTHTPPIEPRWT